MKSRTVCLKITLTEHDIPDHAQIGKELAALTGRHDLGDDELRAIGEQWLAAIQRVIG